jgi:hypothetical protein
MAMLGRAGTDLTAQTYDGQTAIALSGSQDILSKFLRLYQMWQQSLNNLPKLICT